MKLSSPLPSPSGLGEGASDANSFCVTLARFAGERRVRAVRLPAPILKENTKGEFSRKDAKAQIL